MIPSPLALLVLALAALRSWRLLALDTLPVLVWLRDRAVGYIEFDAQLLEVRQRKYDMIDKQLYTDAAEARDEERRLVLAQKADGAVRRPLLAEWLACPWCSGLWIAAAWYAAWAEEPRDTLYAACALAMSSAVGVAQHFLSE